jgi:hypothetical protein
LFRFRNKTSPSEISTRNDDRNTLAYCLAKRGETLKFCSGEGYRDLGGPPSQAPDIFYLPEKESQGQTIAALD